MSITLNPYLHFAGQAEDAMRFYESVFGGKLDLNRFSDFPTEDGSPAPDGVMHAMLVTDNGPTLMASDDPHERDKSAEAGASISLSGDDEEQLRRYWELLSADADVDVPLAKQMWGDTFGMCTDRFGIKWLVNISAPAAS